MQAGQSKNEPDLTAQAGLCSLCEHGRQIKHPRDGAPYWRCLLADADPHFARYPALPVLHCAGYRLQMRTDPSDPSDLSANR